MHVRNIRAPSEGSYPLVYKEFKTWLDRLTTLEGVQVFMNSSIDTARLFDKAHPDAARVGVLEVEVLHGCGEFVVDVMHDEMDYITDYLKSSATGALFVLPFKEVHPEDWGKPKEDSSYTIEFEYSQKEVG